MDKPSAERTCFVIAPIGDEGQSRGRRTSERGALTVTGGVRCEEDRLQGLR